MWTLSGFIDEISPELTEQCRVAAELGLRYAEIRSAWQVNILDLDAAQLDEMKKTLAAYGLPALGGAAGVAGMETFAVGSVQNHPVLLLAAAVVVAANAVSIPIAARCYAAREKR